ncbi:hypothetical protein DY000_02049321 [Brassica cretica]|uniref:Uncharacterized protein n=1 Tax=Brassica cretica TaxID=69181 RepID=A0ABQ7F346_BRACR|nr:hypothetical protein DY000_02049321 [Brassica cretica]
MSRRTFCLSPSPSPHTWTEVMVAKGHRLFSHVFHQLITLVIVALRPESSSKWNIPMITGWRCLAAVEEEMDGESVFFVMM